MSGDWINYFVQVSTGTDYVLLVAETSTIVKVNVREGIIYQNSRNPASNVFVAFKMRSRGRSYE